MSSDDRDYIRKLIRSIKSLMKVCKKSSIKKTRSEALREFCAKTELDDNTQAIANIVERVSRINSETSLKNSEEDSENKKDLTEMILNYFFT